MSNSLQSLLAVELRNCLPRQRCDRWTPYGMSFSSLGERHVHCADQSRGGGDRATGRFVCYASSTAVELICIAVSMRGDNMVGLVFKYTHVGGHKHAYDHVD